MKCWVNCSATDVVIQMTKDNGLGYRGSKEDGGNRTEPRDT